MTHQRKHIRHSKFGKPFRAGRGLRLTTKNIIKYHDDVLRKSGGESGILNRGNIAFTVDKINLAKDPYKKASRAMVGLIQGHGFVDVNKRYAYLLGLNILQRTGLKISATKEEAEKLVINITQGMSEPEVEMWLRRHVR